MTSIGRYENLLNLCVSELDSCVNCIQQYSENKEECFEIVRDIAKHYCEIDISYKNAKRAQETTDKHFDNFENDCSEEVQQVYQKYLTELSNNTSYKNHLVWGKINASIIRQTASDEAEQNLEEDEDMQCDDSQSICEGIILSQFEPPIDPITKKMITDPCRNKICGHIYEFSTIMDFLKGFKDRKSKPKCPHIGCSNTSMQSSHIIKDNAVKEQVRNFLAEHNRSSENTSTSINDTMNVID